MTLSINKFDKDTLSWSLIACPSWTSHEKLVHYVLHRVQSFKAVEVTFVFLLAKNHRENILTRTISSLLKPPCPAPPNSPDLQLPFFLSISTRLSSPFCLQDPPSSSLVHLPQNYERTGFPHITDFSDFSLALCKVAPSKNIFTDMVSEVSYGSPVHLTTMLNAVTWRLWITSSKPDKLHFPVKLDKWQMSNINKISVHIVDVFLRIYTRILTFSYVWSGYVFSQVSSHDGWPFSLNIKSSCDEQIANKLVKKHNPTTLDAILICLWCGYHVTRSAYSRSLLFLFVVYVRL